MLLITTLRRVCSLTLALIGVVLFVGSAYTADIQTPLAPSDTFTEVTVSNGGQALTLYADGAAVDIESTTDSIFLHSKGKGACPFDCNNVVINPYGDEGNVGVGTGNPAQKLHVVGNRIRLEKDSKTLDFRADGSAVDIETTTSDLFITSQRNVVINPRTTNGNVGIGTSQPQAKLEVAGTTRTNVLEIVGGSDLAEPFHVTGSEKIEPGLVVAIDAQHPGQLRLTSQAYDRTVAGIISGAGGIQPGLIMQQGEVLATATYPVALTGRVYVWADTTNGSIQPGDLLTSANRPGYAMKVTDHTRGQGAILGKAMSALKTDTGLVLVLVTLQ